MCLVNLYSAKELKAFKRTLSKEFVVFKAVTLDGCPEYWQEGQDKLFKKGIHKAKNCPGKTDHENLGYRMRLTYPVGFHVFLSEKDALDYASSPYGLSVKKYKAKREWVVGKGIVDSVWCRVPCVVLSKIEVI